MDISSLPRSLHRNAAPDGSGTVDSLRGDIDALLKVAKDIASRMGQLDQIRGDRPGRAGLDVAVDSRSPDALDALVNTAVTAIDRQSRQPDFGAPGLFANRAWLLVLELFVADRCGRAVSVKEAALTLEGAQTTALRKLLALEQHGVVASREDLTDGRRRLVGLTESATNAVASYLASLAESAMPPPAVRLRVRHARFIETVDAIDPDIAEAALAPNMVRAVHGPNTVLQS